MRNKARRLCFCRLMSWHANVWIGKHKLAGLKALAQMLMLLLQRRCVLLKPDEFPRETGPAPRVA